MLYADGREADAADVLRRALDGAPGDADRAEIWQMLFDLLRGNGDWRSYQDLASRYAQTHAMPAPAWHDEEEMARLPPELRPGAPGCFAIVGALDASRAQEMERVQAAARDLAGVHLDVSRVSGIDEPGCTALTELLRFLTGNGNSIVFTGARHLVELLRAAAEGHASAPGYWALLLEIYRLCGMQTDFERAALEFALAMGATPPVWQPIVMPLPPTARTEEKRDQPRYEVGPELLTLSGVIWTATDPQFFELREFSAERQYVNINLAHLRRIDFGCAAVFADLLNAQVAAGKTVRLLRPNSLVSAFLRTLSLNPEIQIIAARRRA